MKVDQIFETLPLAIRVAYSCKGDKEALQNFQNTLLNSFVALFGAINEENIDENSEYELKFSYPVKGKDSPEEYTCPFIPDNKVLTLSPVEIVKAFIENLAAGIQETLAIQEYAREFSNMREKISQIFTYLEIKAENNELKKKHFERAIGAIFLSSHFGFFLDFIEDLWKIPTTSSKKEYDSSYEKTSQPYNDSGDLPKFRAFTSESGSSSWKEIINHFENFENNFPQLYKTYTAPDGMNDVFIEQKKYYFSDPNIEMLLTFLFDFLDKAYKGNISS